MRLASRCELAFCAALFLTTSAAHAQTRTVTVHDGFITGETYLKWDKSYQDAYVMGIVDGMFLAPLFGAPERNVTWLEHCLVGMSDTQVAAILAKYLRDHPERWHESVHVPMYSAMKDICPG